MADPATYRPAAGTIPDSPGVYRFRDEHGRVVYVGKAKSLRSRISSYFQDLANLHPRTQAMVLAAASVEWTVVETEVEALQLEYSWIKEHDPRFNIRYRDDKSYPFLAATLYEEYPRLQVMRGAKKKGVRYFGPYAHAWAIRETLDLLLRVFPGRTCSNGVFKRAHQVGRPCLLGYIGKCSAPCVGRVDAAEHRRIVEDFCDFMSGQTATYVRRLEKEMQVAAANLEYERAARLRDDIAALNRALERNAVVLGDGTDADVIGCSEDPLEAAFQVFHVRGGRIRGQRGFVVDKVEETGVGDLVEHFLQQFYGEETGETVPREVLVSELPADPEPLAEWLSGRRGSRVQLRVPRRGDKRALLETVGRNAGQALALHKTKRASDLTTRSVALQEIQDALGLETAPLRIECFDVSNLQGSDVVASMVVFEDGLARKSEYRRFGVRGFAGQNDVAAIHEVVSRRFRRYLEEQEAVGALADVGNGAADALAEGGQPPSEDAEPLAGEPTGDAELEAAADGVVITDARGRAVEMPAPVTDGRPRKFAYPPNLVVVDGGAPQVAAAQRALDELGIDNVALCGLAKRLEEVWLPGEVEPIILARASEGLYLLQRIRDEAHRFAITFHRQKRSRSMTASTLDRVPGLGEVRRKALIAHFGSLRKLKAASAEQIAEVPGIGRRTAEAIVAALAAGPAPAPAVNTATGELLDEPPP